MTKKGACRGFADAAVSEIQRQTCVGFGEEEGAEDGPKDRAPHFVWSGVRAGAGGRGRPAVDGDGDRDLDDTVEEEGGGDQWG